MGLTSLCCCGTNTNALTSTQILLSYPIEKHRSLGLQHWKPLECYTTQALREFFLVKIRQDDSFQAHIFRIRAWNTYFIPNLTESTLNFI